MKQLLRLLFFVLLGFTLIFGLWYVLHNDIQYTSDVARDFFLLREISQKGIVLIGPSSSTKLYHGILWMYLNYPVFALSRGNPIASGWFWVFLSATSVFGGFFIAKNLFNTTTAYFYTLILSFFLAFHVRYLYNPDGVMLVTPFLFFAFVHYLQTKKQRFLAIHTLLLGACIQFEMAIGVPLALLSLLYLLYSAIKHKLAYKDLLWFLLIPLLQINFIIFDFRHSFLISKLALHFLTSAGRDHGNIFSMIWQRILFMVGSVEFFHKNPWNIVNALVTLFVFFMCIVQIRSKRFARTYKVFLYFYIGFFVVSLANGGGLLPFYVYPLFPLVFLIFASLITAKQKVLFLFIFILLYASNVWGAYQDMTLENTLAGNSSDSWLSYKNLAQTVLKKSNNFGYFVFDPDIVAYQPKYAMFYVQDNTKNTAFYMEKKPLTYLIIAPNLYHQEIYWTQKQLHIEKQPDAVTKLNNGYLVEKFLLSGNDLTIPIEPNLDPGIMFR